MLYYVICVLLYAGYFEYLTSCLVFSIHSSQRECDQRIPPDPSVNGSSTNNNNNNKLFTIPQRISQRPLADREARGLWLRDCCVVSAETRMERREIIRLTFANNYPLFLPFRYLPRKLLYYITCL